MRAVIGMVLGIAAGLALGAWLWRSPAPAPIEHRPEIQVPRTSAVVHPREIVAPIIVTSSAMTLRRALDDIVPPSPERGAGRISGHVRTEDEAPLAGVEVVITPDDSDSISGDDVPETGGKVDIEAAVRSLVRRLRAREAAAFRAVTDARGAFEVTGLPVVSCRVAARKEGFAIECESPVRPDAVVAAVARRDLRLPVEVLLPDGRPPDHARIQFSRGRDQVDRPWRPDAPSVSISPGAWTVSGIAGDRDELHAPPQEVTIEVGVAPLPVTLRMVSRPGIAVTVRAPDDEQPVRDGVSVYVLRATGGQTPKTQRMQEEGNQQSAWSGTPIVVFVTTPGSYFVAAGRAGCMPCTMQVTEVPDGIVPLEIALPPLDAKDGLMVHVFGPGGEPVRRAGFEVFHRAEGQSQDSPLYIDTIAMRDGSWRLLGSGDTLSGQRPTPLSQRPLTLLRVSGTDFGATTARLFQGQTEVTVRFESAAMLHVSVPGLLGSPLDGALDVVLGSKQQNGTWDSSERSSSFDADGCVRFGPIAPGAYDVVGLVHSAGNSGSRIAGSEVQLVLRPGLNEATLPLPRVYEVDVMSQKDASLRLLFKGESGSFAADIGAATIEADAGDDGRARFERVPAGRYLFCDDSMNVFTFVSVPAPGPLRFEHRPADALLVYAIEPAEPPGRAGLAEGDYVVEINGEPFTIEGDMSERLEPLRGQEVTLTIQRGAGRRRVTVAGDDLASRNGVTLINAWAPR